MSYTDLIYNRFKIYIDDGEISSEEVSLNISNNINNKFILRKYQIEALNSLRYYYEDFKRKIKPIHLLFNMATGSGKTLLMATNILYLYEKGYRNFIFFVDSTNIIEKTKQNFLDSTSSKYLFSGRVQINNREVTIREIENFDEADEDSINIIFTTIQGLHYRMNNPSENSVTYEDFNDKKVVLLSDEAHHINSLTKERLNKTEQEMKSSWEHTVTTILNSNKENMLLEYTATIGLENESIYNKYKDKIIYRYDLKEYREDKYSKEITVLRSEMAIKERILQAVILSEYKRKVAEKKGLLVKPVLLIKSARISDSEAIRLEFEGWIDNLSTKDLSKLINTEQDNVISRAFRYFKNENINMENLIIEIKNNFARERLIEVNSKNDSEQKQIIVNTLEDRENPYRVVFAVDMLNEGWDVLNLFDIVRVNEGRGSKNTTTKEAQLIGRGARYYPFQLNESDNKYKRKFDEELNNELRILETLHYHSVNESKYISELKTELEKMGIVAKEEDRMEINLKLKDSFKESSLYKTGFIFYNKQIVNKNINIGSLEDMKIKKQYEYHLSNNNLYETIIMDEKAVIKSENYNRTSVLMDSIPKNILRKGVSTNRFFTFKNLTKYFPNIKSIDEFICSRDYLSSISTVVVGDYTKISDLTDEDLLAIVLFVLRQVEVQILKNYTPYKGTEKFYTRPINSLKLEKSTYISIGGSDKESGKSMSMNDGSSLRLDLSKQDWYAYEDNYGTSEEKNLVLLMKELYVEMIKKGYREIYLLRNEKILRLYHFDDDRVVEPDFILLSKHRNNNQNVFFQVFIESKGNQLLETDAWKEDLLRSIEERYKAVLSKPKNNKGSQVEESEHILSFIPEDYGRSENLIIENERYKLIGLGFYNKDNEMSFKNEIKTKLKI